MTALNAAVAMQLIEFKKEIDEKMKSGMKKEEAIYDTLRHYIKACKYIRFDGNGYSDEWKACLLYTSIIPSKIVPGLLKI